MHTRTPERPEFEDLLRASLAERAGDVRPDPRTWGRVQARIRRRQTFRLAAAGFAAAAAVAFAAVVAPALLTGSRVDLDPGTPAGPPAGPPGPQPTAQAPAPPPSPQIDRQAPDGPVSTGVVSFAFSQAGDVFAVRADGWVDRLTTSADLDAHPALSPDGATVVFDRRDHPRAAAELFALDVASGRERRLGDGEQPVFGPDGQLAWVHQPGPEGGATTIVVDRDGDGAAELEFAASDEAGDALAVSNLTFDVSGSLLAYETYWEAPVVRVADVSGDGPPQPGTLLPLDSGEGGTYAAPTASVGGAFDVLHRCCVEIEGDRNDFAEVGRVTLGPGGVVATGYEGTVALPDDFDADVTSPIVRAVGAVSVQGRGEGQFRLVPGDRQAWLVGDGQGLWLAEAGGGVTRLADGVDGVGVRPAAAPPPSTTSASVDGSEPAPGRLVAQVYLPRNDLPDASCETTYALPRSVPSAGPLRGALEALLAGPSDEERAHGYGGWFSADTAGLLAGVTIGDGTAYVDFEPALRDRIGTNVTSSCGALQLLSQLDNTVQQFPSVQRAVYSLGGDVEAFYAWLQMAPPR